MQPPLKTKDHWRHHIIKIWKGEEKSYPRTHLTLNNNNDLTLPHHEAKPFQQFHELSYATSLLWTVYIVNQTYFKVEVQWTHMNMKSHGSWKVMREVKESQGVSITPGYMYPPSLYEQKNFHVGSSRKSLERSVTSLRSKEWL